MRRSGSSSIVLGGLHDFNAVVLHWLYAELHAALLVGNEWSGQRKARRAARRLRRQYLINADGVVVGVNNSHFLRGIQAGNRDHHEH
jgi:hypothetical protein